MPSYAKLPDGNYIKVPDDWTPEQVDSAVYRDFPQLFPDRKPEPTLGEKALGIAGDAADAVMAAFSGPRDLKDLGSPGVRDMRSAIPETPPELELDAISGAQPRMQSQDDIYRAADLMGMAPSAEEAAAAGLKKLGVGAVTNLSGGTLKWLGETFKPYQSDMLPKEAYTPGVSDILSELGSSVIQKGQELSQGMEPRGSEMLSPTDPRRAMMSGLESTGTMLPALALSALTKNPSAGLSLLGAGTSGQYIDEAKKAGLSDEAANLVGNIKGWGGETAMELVPFNILFKKWGKDAVKEGLKYIAAESLGEYSTETINALVDRLSIKPDMTMDDFMGNLKALTAQLPIALTTTAAAGKTMQAGVNYAAQKTQEADMEKFREQIMAEFADRQAREALNPDQRTVAPDLTTQRQSQVGPPAAPATAREENTAAYTDILNQLNDAMDTGEAADKLGGKRSGARQLDEREAYEFEQDVMRQRNQASQKQSAQEEVDAVFAAREKQLADEAAKRRDEDYGNALVQDATERTEQQEAVNRTNQTYQAPTMGDLLSRAFDEKFTQTKPVKDKEAKDGYTQSLEQPVDEDGIVGQVNFQQDVDKVDADGNIELVHYSSTPGIEQLDPAFYGKGLKGEEAARKAADPENWVDRSYFFVGTPEKKEAGLGSTEYRVDMPSQKLYDAEQDPLDLKAQANGNRNLYERLIRDAGYDGAVFDATQGRAAMVFVKTTPKRNMKTDRPGGATAEFFTRMTLGEDGKPDTQYTPVIEGIEKKTQFLDEYQKHRGNFDNHIAASIPGFRDLQVFTGDALAKTLGKDATVLDIGASEGSWAKTVTAVSGAKSVSLDPLPAMQKHFEGISSVPGATFEMKAFGDEGWTENDGTRISPFWTKQKFDVVHESMTFQFIDNNRADHIRRAKSYLKPEGVLLTEEKFRDDGTQEYKNREAQKDAYKRQYFTDKAIKNKAKDTLAVGMNDNMVTREELEQALSDQFEFVAEYWNASNFGGYAASDSREALQDFLDNMDDTNTQYSSRATPRWVKDETPAMLKPQAGPDAGIADFAPSVEQEQAYMRDAEGRRISETARAPRSLAVRSARLIMPTMKGQSKLGDGVSGKLMPEKVDIEYQDLIVAFYEDRGVKTATKEESAAIELALSRLQESGMPIGAIFDSVRAVFTGQNFTAIKGQEESAAIAAQILSAVGNKNIIAIGKKRLADAIDEANQGSRSKVYQYRLLETIAHELTHTIDYGFQAPGEVRDSASSTSPLFELKLEEDGAVTTGDVLKEMIGVYAADTLGLQATLAYPFDLLVQKGKGTPEVVKSIKAEAFAQLGMLYWSMPNSRNVLREAMPKSIKLMEEIDNVLKSNAGNPEARDRAIREILRADTNTGAQTASGQPAVPRYAAESRAERGGRAIDSEVQGERDADGRGSRADNELLSSSTLNANPVSAYAAVYRNNAQKAIDLFNEKIGWRYGPLGALPQQDAYLAARRKTLGEIANVERITDKVYNTFRDASDETKQQIFEYMTTVGADPAMIADEQYRFRAASTKRLINRVGKALAERGLIGYETLDEHQDAYLPRIYLRHILGDKAYGNLAGGKVPSKMGYTKMRKDVPEDIRRIVLGEIKDPGFLASRALGVEMRDIAILDFLEEVSQNQDWIYPESAVEWRGELVSIPWLKDEAEAIERQAAHYKDPERQTALALVQEMKDVYEPAIEAMGQTPGDFKMLPNTKKFGRLRGIMVRKEIYDDLMGSIAAHANTSAWADWFGQGGKGTKLTQKWKLLKVPFNPPAQIRNAMSNMVLLHLSGLTPTETVSYVARAIKETRTNGKYYRIARKQGVTESTFTNNELYRAERDVLDLLDRMQGSKGSWAHVKNLAGILADFAGNAYQAIEAIGKTAKIMHAMEKEGMTEDQAGAEAQKWLFDYSLVPPVVRDARNMPVGMPFITFYYKVLPRLLETAIKRPVKFLPYFLVPHLASAMFAWMYDADDDDMDKLHKTMPQWLQDKGHAVLLPYKDEYGRWQAYDFSYLLPWSMFVNMGNAVKDQEYGQLVSESGLFGGPIPNLITAWTTNKDPFTGRDIVTEGASKQQQMVERLNYLYTLAAPTWLTNQGFAGKLMDAIEGDVDPRTGDHPLTVGQASLRLLGQNVYPFEPDISRRKNMRSLNYEIKTMQMNMRSAVKREPDPEKRREIREDWRARIQEKVQERNKYAKDSQLPARLK